MKRHGVGSLIGCPLRRLLFYSTAYNFIRRTIGQSRSLLGEKVCYVLVQLKKKKVGT